MTKFTIPKQAVLKAVTHSFHELPYEACGLLLRRGGVGEMQAIPVKNDSADQDSFEMCADDLYRWYESDAIIYGTYHSHPRGIAVPSEGDLDLLEPGKLHMIVGMKGGLFVQLWQFKGAGEAPLLLDMSPIGA